MQQALDTERFNMALCIAGGYSTLSRLLATPLEEADVNNLREGEDVDHLEEYLSCWGVDVSAEVETMRVVLASGDSAEVASRLNIECTRLFHVRLPEPPAIPYESVWREPERLVGGRCTVEVAQAYREAEVHPSEQFADAAPDHIARELAFIAVTARNEAMALQNGDQAEADRWAAIRNRFVDEHVSKWVPDFFNAITADDKSEFFSAVAGIGRRLLEVATEQQDAA